MAKPCDCHLHPDFLTLCDPCRGGFNCAGEYRMPPLPKGIVCQKFKAPMVHVYEPTEEEKAERLLKVAIFIPGDDETKQ